MALARLFSETEASAFMEQYFSRLPFVAAHGCIASIPLGSWETVSGIITQPGVDLVVGCSTGARVEKPPATMAELRELLSAGFTVGIRKAHQHDEAIAQLANDFQRDFMTPIDVHIYCTPQGAPGFGWHYDAEDVFILQTHGSKQWWLRKNTVDPWPLIEALPHDMRYHREIMPLSRCTIAAGDWLYIPPGYWHRSEAREESISLSIGIQSPTGLDVFDFLRQRLLRSMRWRERLPPAGRASTLKDSDLLRAYQDRCKALGADLAELLKEPRFAEEFLSSQLRSTGRIA
jgi:ribosomal protein L16 Arg81 hydroxylase